MGFNTKPSTIREIQSWIHRTTAQIKNEMSRTEPGTPEYQYLEQRLEYCDKHSAQLGAMVGKSLPPKRDRSNEKNLPPGEKTRKR
jgi:hypothetical protein